MSTEPDHIVYILTGDNTSYPVDVGFDHLLNDWIHSWRCASSPEKKRSFVQSVVVSAVRALKSGLLTYEEAPPIFHEVLFMHVHGNKDLHPAEIAAWQEAYNRWRYEFFPGCSCVLCIKGGLMKPATTPGNSPEQNLAPPAVLSPEEQPKRKRGRPAGSKDVMKRAARNSQKASSKAEKSKRSRQTQKERKAILEQQLQQQQQTPPF